MLKDKSAMANLAVRDLDKARKFYEGSLGLTPVATEEDDVIVFKSGASTLNVYKSQYAGTNKATAVTWAVGNELDDLVKTLKSKGISFEHYDLPGMTRQGDIHKAGEIRTAWFKDPDGNILNLINH
jgi:catechol 2,3-dioxygenase-like lactoylglutathione lyase family enzyme